MTYWFSVEGPEFGSLDIAKADWLKDHDSLPTAYHWRAYDGDVPVAEGSTALEPPYGTVVHWDDR